VLEVGCRCDQHILCEWHIAQQPPDPDAPLPAIAIVIKDDEEVHVTIRPGITSRLGSEQDDLGWSIRGNDRLDSFGPGGANVFIAN